MLTPELIDAFRFHRQRLNPRHWNAAHALEAARKDVTANKKRYPHTSPQSMRGGEPFAAYGEKAMTWFENPEAHLRFVGKAHDIINLRHTGWYIDDMQHETTHGVVYQLPARNGKTQYLYGYADTWSGANGACLSLDIADDKEDAARWADGIAERFAESEREYREAGSARMQFDDLGAEISAARKSCLALIREFKANRVTFGDMPEIRKTVCAHVESYRSDIEKARDEREKLESNYGRHDGWKL